MHVKEFLMKKLWKIIDKQIFWKYCTIIVIIYMSVPTTYMSFSLVWLVLGYHRCENITHYYYYYALYAHTDLVAPRVVGHAGAAAAGPAGEGPGGAVSPLPAAANLPPAHPAAPARQPGQPRLKMGGRSNRALNGTLYMDLTSDFTIKNLLRHYSKR